MNDRLVGMKRILKVQDQIKRIADWRVAEAERSKREIEEAQRELAAYMDDTALDGALAAESEKAREAQGRQKLVGRFVDALSRDDRTARERKDLDTLIEAFKNRTAQPDAEPDPTTT